MTVKNITFKNTYIGKLKKNTIHLKNIVKGVFFFKSILVQLLVSICWQKKSRRYGFYRIKEKQQNIIDLERF